MTYPSSSLKVLLFSGTLITVLMGWDLISDYKEGSSAPHLIAEALVFAIGALAMVFSLKKLLEFRVENHDLQLKLKLSQEEKDQWKREANDLIQGLSVQIDSQFKRWELSPTENEVGFLILKGISLKEIAHIRGTKLKTVQQQARSIYQKSHTSNRSELAAFFLEDLLPPMS